MRQPPPPVARRFNRLIESPSNLKHPRGIETLKHRLARCDVLAESFSAGALARRPPPLGEHGAEAYAEIGPGDADLARVRCEGIIGQPS